MTKRELINRLNELLNEKKMRKIETFSGKINENCNKSTIEDVIKCLETTDDDGF